MKIEPINVNVKFDVSENFKQTVATLCGAILKLGHGAAAPAQEQKPAEPEAKPVKVEQKPAKVEQPAEQPAPAQEVKQDPKPAEPEQPAAAPAEEKPIQYTAADVRGAMDRCRKRIEGDDYKEHPESEGYKTYHRALTSWFKNTAALYGYEKPSAIEENEKRAAFIRDCNNVEVIDGELKINNLPY